jgi:hypothetical protein
MPYRCQSADTNPFLEKYYYTLQHSVSLIYKSAIVTGLCRSHREMSLLALQIRDRDNHDLPPHRLYQQWLCQNNLNYLFISPNFDLTQFMSFDLISLGLEVTEILQQLRINYYISGSVASSLLGEPRTTYDIDLVIDSNSEQASQLFDAFSPRFYLDPLTVAEALERHSSFNMIDNQTLGKIDIFILDSSPFHQSAFHRRASQLIREHPQRYLCLPTPEDLILQKLLWRKDAFGSEKQWRDILGICKLQNDRLDLNYLHEWGTTLNLSVDLHRLLQESGLIA